MNNDFEQFFKSCKADRLDMLHNKFYELQNVKSFEDNASKVFYKINGFLPQDIKPELTNYDSIRNAILTKNASYFYGCGFEDGFLMGRLLFGNEKNISFDISVL